MSFSLFVVNCQEAQLILQGSCRTNAYDTEAVPPKAFYHVAIRRCKRGEGWN